MNLASLVGNSKRLVYVLGGAIALLVFLSFVFIVKNFSSSTGGGGTADLQVWGVFDDNRAFSDAISAYQKLHKGVHITYTEIPYADYETRLVNALAAHQGPDIFMIHNTWLARHGDKVFPLPTGNFPGMKTPLMTERQFRSLFVDVAATDLIRGGKIFGMPLYVDTLALFYNKDFLNSAGIAHAPVTWTEFMDDVKKLTTYDASRNILRSGAAIGTARNINRSTDLLMMLMLQSGVQMTNPDGNAATFSKSVNGQPVGERSLEFYTDFANPQKEVYTWNDTQDYNVDAFTSGKTAMMMNYAHQIGVIREHAPRMNFGIAKMPQPSADVSRSYADYWPLVVSLGSKHPYDAWLFVQYLAIGDGTVPYLNATGRPTARIDLIDQEKTDPDLGVFAEQALTARSWYQINNQAIETIFADMIDAVNLGKQSVAQALREAESKVSVLMSQK